ncbi:MAG: ATP-binding protein [Anaerolineaceae bacterium]|nr:ATP-binding protein [Anaerolineaceae bacterium]
MFSEVPFRRELVAEDLERMRVPRRYWGARFDEISDEGGNDSLKYVVGKYIDDLDNMLREGLGFILFGDNGTGKTCASVVLGKELRRRGNTVLFMEAADLKRQVIDKEHFDEDETYWDRAKTVDVLILDDFGKGVMDSTGFGATIFDELIRARNARKLVTIITTNTPPDQWAAEFELKASTIKTLKECLVPQRALGEDKRETSAMRLKELLAN